MKNQVSKYKRNKKLKKNNLIFRIRWNRFIDFNSFFFFRTDYSEVHNIEDSDDEQFIEEQNIQNMQPSHGGTVNVKPFTKSYDDQHTFEEDRHFGKHPAIGIKSNSSNGQYRNYVKTTLQKQSASKLQRYLAVKRSIKWYVCHVMSCYFPFNPMFVR